MGCRGHRAGDGWVEPVQPAPKRKRDNAQHRELCLLAAQWLRRSNIRRPYCPYAAVELVTAGQETPDVFGWNYWTSVMIEVKVSRSDFLSDAKKPFRQNPAEGVGEFRYYCCPQGLISANEVPVNWGLLWLEGSKITEEKAAKRQESNGGAERTIITSIMRREGVKPQCFDYRKNNNISNI